MRIAALIAAAVVVGAGPASASDLVYSSNRCDQQGEKPPENALPAGCDREVWALEADGKSRQLTFNAVDDVLPALSPDGGRLAWVSYGGGVNLWVSDVDGAAPRRLDLAGTDPGWSPSGDRLAVSVVSPDHNAIWTVGADGTLPLQITDGQHDDTAPVFTPDGTRIAFVRDGIRPGSRIAITSVAGGPVLDLTSTDLTLPYGGIAFSSDCRHLAFSAAAPGESLFQTGIWTLDLANLAVRRVAERGYEPTWRPDGRTVVYAWLVDMNLANQQLFQVDAFASDAKPSQITALPYPENAYMPSGRPPGTPLGAACLLADKLPPLVGIGEALDDLIPALPVRGASVARVRRISRRRLHFLATDRSGVRSLRVAFARRGARPVFRSVSGWKSRTRRLRPGRYTVTFEGTDGRGNRGRRSARVVLTR